MALYNATFGAVLMLIDFIENRVFILCFVDSYGRAISIATGQWSLPYTSG